MSVQKIVCQETGQKLEVVRVVELEATLYKCGDSLILVEDAYLSIVQPIIDQLLTGNITFFHLLGTTLYTLKETIAQAHYRIDLADFLTDNADSFDNDGTDVREEDAVIRADGSNNVAGEEVSFDQVVIDEAV